MNPLLFSIPAFLLTLAHGQQQYATPAAYQYTTYESPAKAQEHREVQIEYKNAPYQYQQPYQPSNYQPDVKSTVKPQQNLAYQPPKQTTTTSTTPKPYSPLIFAAPPTATYAPEPYLANNPKEEVVQGMPYSVRKVYELNLVSYQHPYPSYTTQYQRPPIYTTTTSSYTTPSTTATTTPYQRGRTARATYSPSPTYTTTTTTTATTTYRPPQYDQATVTYEKYPRPESHVNVQPSYSEKPEQPQIYYPQVKMPAGLNAYGDNNVNYGTTTPRYDATTQRYFQPYFAPLPTAQYEVNPFVPSPYQESVHQGMPYAKKDVIEYKNVDYTHNYPIYTTHYPMYYQETTTTATTTTTTTTTTTSTTTTSLYKPTPTTTLYQSPPQQPQHYQYGNPNPPFVYPPPPPPYIAPLPNYARPY